MESLQHQQNSKIQIFSKSPFSNSYENTIRFNNAEEQREFFEKKDSKLIKEIYSNNSFSFIEKNNDINIEGKLSDFENATYMCFQNEGRWFYAFIVHTYYINAGTVGVAFEIDVFQTYHLELFSQQIQGYVQQAHVRQKNKDGKYNIIPSLQGFNVGEKFPSLTKEIKQEIKWVVFVMKPSTKVGDKDIFKGGMVDIGALKNFKYYVLPLVQGKGSSYVPKTTMGNITIEKMMFNAVFDELTNTFSLETNQNTVNQAVNVYITNNIGVEYEYDSDNEHLKITKNKGVFMDALPIGSAGNSESGGSDTGSSGLPPAGTTENDLTNAGHVLKADIINTIIQMGKLYKILPMGMICQLFLESHWGDSNVAKIDNNWGGMTWFEGYRGYPDITVSKGSARPSSEGGYYVHYNSVNDYIKDYTYLLRPNNLYVVSGKTTISEFCKGLFLAGGASADYAASGYSHYNSLITSIENAIIKENGKAKVDAINSQVYENGVWKS